MTKTKLKTLSLSKASSEETEGEHHVIFVASDASTDRDYEQVQIETFRLPVKGGGADILVRDIPETGADNVDIPLLTDHDLRNVSKVIGSVRRAYFTNGKLIFDCGISSRDYAQDVFKLLSEGHLDNAFSISFGDYKADRDGNLTDGEIVEVSLVTRGSNKDATLIETKSVKEDEVEETPQETSEAVKVEEVVEEPAETVEEKPETEAVETETEPAEEAAAEPAAEPVEEVKPAEPVETPEEKSTIKEETMDKSIAMTEVKSQATQAKSVETNYLSSKAAVKDFARTISENKGNQAIIKAWSANLASKGITGDQVLPTEIEQVFFKAWNDDKSLINTFRTINVNAASAYAMTGEGEGIRAKGHTKGEVKADQNIEAIRRDLKAKIIYKKLPIDLQDLIDDETGELLRFRTEELAERVVNEIVVSAIAGDGRKAGTPDYRTFDGTRGLFSMAADIAAAKDGGYAGAVATEVAGEAGDDNYAALVKTLAKVNGDEKVAVVSQDFITALRLTKNAAGAYVFPAGVSLDDVFGAEIHVLPEMSGADYEVIAYAKNAYMLAGKDNFVRTDFDMNNNTDVMLVERSAAGSLTGYKTAAGYKKAA